MKKNQNIFLIKAIAIILLFAFFLHSQSFAQQKVLKLYDGDKTKWMQSLQVTESGLKYEILEPGEGETPNPGDKVAVHYIGALANDTIFDNSYESGEPLIFDYDVGQVIKGWDEGIGLLKPGGKAVLVVPPKLGYGSSSVMGIPPNSTLFFKIELIDVMENKDFKPFETKGKDTLSTASGLQYIVVDSGLGEQSDTASWAYFHYTGYLPSGKIFDASFLRGDPVRINPGKGEVIPAWDEALQLMRVGSKFHIIVPPELAYGDAGLQGVVPSGTQLRFDLELMHVSEKREPKPFDVAGKDTVKLDSGLQYIPVAKGEGEKPENGDMVKVHFSGYMDGELFQSSLKTDEPAIFALGQGHVIKGIDRVVAQMKAGGKARAIIPWQLGYGEEGNLPIIPPKKDLVFDIELVSVVK